VAVAGAVIVEVEALVVVVVLEEVWIDIYKQLCIQFSFMRML